MIDFELHKNVKFSIGNFTENGDFFDKYSK